MAQEKGFNTYKKVDDSKCKGASDWWLKHHKKWQLVRTKWNTVFEEKTDLTLHEKVKNKNLYKYLFSEEYVEKNKIDEIIQSFVAN